MPHWHGSTLPEKPPETLTAEIGCFPRSVLVAGPPPPAFTSADKSPLNQLAVIFFINHQNILPLTPMYFSWKTINFSVWIKEICIQLVKLHIICSRMQRGNLHARPYFIQVGVPPVVIRYVHWTIQTGVGWVVGGVGGGGVGVGWWWRGGGYCRPGLPLNALPS